MGDMNDCPLTIPSQKSRTPIPAGVTTPMPVITASLDIHTTFTCGNIGEYKCGLKATKAAGGGYNVLHCLFPRYIRNIIKITFWIGSMIVDRGWNNPTLEDESASSGLYRPYSPQGVPDH